MTPFQLPHFSPQHLHLWQAADVLSRLRSLLVSQQSQQGIGI
jgi:hypothetical protein